ncbi:MAG: NAD(P)/FAD-dependent oxidoreductase [Candidatus Micrarchaeia archaeon]
MHTFCIAGAGPAGLACAINLAKAGERVRVFERSRRVGSRFAGSFQFLENFSHTEGALSLLRRAGIDRNFELVPQRRMTVFGPSMKEHELTSRKPLWYMLRRGSGRGTLDAGLLEQARASGAEVKFGKAVGESEVDVIATGARRADGIARELVFETDEELHHILLDDRIAPKGYAYVFSHGGRATLCVAIMRDFRRIGAYFENGVKRLQEKLGFEIRRPKEQANFVSFYIPRRLAIGGKLVAGEAAGFQDFLFGFGLRYAIESGWMAAAHLAGEEDYERAARERIFHFLEAGVANRFLFELLGNKGYEWLAGRAERAGDAREFLGRWTAPSVFKRLMQRIIRATVWRKRGRCGHGENCVWCSQR